MAPSQAAVRIDTMVCGATYSAIWVALLLMTSFGVSTSVTVSPDHSSRQENRTRNSSARALVETKGAADCYKFIRMFNTLTADGDLFIAAGVKVSALQCQNACLGYFRSRVCVAAIHRHSGHCLLAGYKLYPNPKTTHFRRLCRKGRACFASMLGMETRFHTGMIGLPPVGPAAEVVAADLCRRECEQLVFCVGFDVIEDTSYCPYTEIRPGSNLYFTMYLRSC